MPPPPMHLRHPQRLHARKFVLLIVLVLTAGCATSSASSGSGTDDAGATWQRTELYFGLSTSDGRPIPDAQWRQFLDQRLTPALPDGLTVLAGEGQYVDAAGRQHQEPCRLVIVLYPPGQADAVNRRIQDVVAEYLRDFHQESVLRTDATQQVRFLTARAATHPATP